MDLTFLILVLILLTIGLIMLFSASYANAYYLMGNSFHYISRQMAFAVVGVIAMLAASKIDYHFWRRFAIPMMALSIVLLLVVFAMPPINHAHRWIFIGSSFNFQPSEVAKFAVVLLFSHLIDVNYQRMHKFEYGILPFGAILGVLAVLLIAEPHLSGTILIVGLGVIMMIVGGIRLSHLFLAGGAGGTALILLVLVLGKWDRMMGRIEHWLNPFPRPPGRGVPDHPIPVCHRFRRAFRLRHRQQPPEIPLPARTSERLHLLHRLRGAGAHWGGDHHHPVRPFAVAGVCHRPAGQG